MKKYLLQTGFLILSLCACGQNIVSAYAGTVTAGLVNGDTASSRFKNPFGICMDKNSNIYVADGGNNCIRKITPSGMVSILAGTGIAGYADGPIASAQFNSPTGVCADDSGNVYVSDFLNHRIRKISVTGSVTTISGSGTAGYLDGSPATAQFNYPRGICRDKNGNLYVGDSWNHRIRKVSVNGTASTYAGGGNSFGVSSVGAYVDAKDTAARFYTPAGLSIDKSGNVYVADAYNHRIRRIDTARNVTTVAGSGLIGNGNGGYANGAVNAAVFNTPTELHVDSLGKIYIGDTFNNRVRLVAFGFVSTLAGKGTAGYANGIDSLAEFNYTRGVVCNASGNKVYVADYTNNCIRKITLSSTSSVSKINSASKQLSLFPNPNNGAFKINYEGPVDGVISVCNLTGKQIWSGLLDLSGEIQVSGLQPGYYILTLSTKETISHTSFIKQ